MHFIGHIYVIYLHKRNVRISITILEWTTYNAYVLYKYVCCTWNFQYTFSTGGFERTLHWRYTVSPTLTTFPGPAFVRDRSTLGGSVIIWMFILLDKNKVLFAEKHVVSKTITWHNQENTIQSSLFCLLIKPSIAQQARYYNLQQTIRTYMQPWFSIDLRPFL